MLEIALAVAALAVVLTWRGWRGKRVGDHPFCRRCGFDLFGKPGDSHNCPECGAPLSAKGAIVIGVRQRNTIALAFGVPLLLVGLVVGGAISWGMYRDVNWQQHKPVAWLKWEARGSDRVVQVAALRELLRRLAAGQLSNEEVASIVEMGLKAQGDMSKPWLVEWGDFIEAARGAGKASDAQWQKYARQAVSLNWLTFRTRPKIHVHDRVVSQLAANPARVGRSASFFAYLHDWSIVIDGKECPLQSDPGGVLGVSCFVTGTMGGNRQGIEETIRRLPPGQHSGHVLVKVRVTDGPLTFNSRVLPIPRPPASRDPKVVQKWIDSERQAIEAQRTLLAARGETQRAAAKAAADGTDGRPTYASVELKCPVNFELIAGEDSPSPQGDDGPLKDVVDQLLRADK